MQNAECKKAEGGVHADRAVAVSSGAVRLSTFRLGKMYWAWLSVETPEIARSAPISLLRLPSARRHGWETRKPRSSVSAACF